MPTPSLTTVDLRRQAFRELLSALKDLSPDLIAAIVKAFPNDPPLPATEPDPDRLSTWYANRTRIDQDGTACRLQPLDDGFQPAIMKLKAVPDFIEWAMFAEYRWRDDPTKDPPNVFLSMIPVPVIPSMPLDRADLQRPVLAFPEDETEDHFIASARAHYRARATSALPRVATRSQLGRAAAWYVRHWILGSALSEIDAEHQKYVSKKVNEFSELLRKPLNRRPGRPPLKK